MSPRATSTGVVDMLLCPVSYVNDGAAAYKEESQRHQPRCPRMYLPAVGVEVAEGHHHARHGHAVGDGQRNDAAPGSLAGRNVLQAGGSQAGRALSMIALNDK